MPVKPREPWNLLSQEAAAVDCATIMGQMYGKRVKTSILSFVEYLKTICKKNHLASPRGFSEYFEDRMKHFFRTIRQLTTVLVEGLVRRHRINVTVMSSTIEEFARQYARDEELPFADELVFGDKGREAMRCRMEKRKQALNHRVLAWQRQEMELDVEAGSRAAEEANNGLRCGNGEAFKASMRQTTFVNV